MPRRKRRSDPLCREAVLKAEDEYMLKYGHMSLWFDFWYRNRGKSIIEAKDEAQAEREAQLPTVRLASEEVAAPVSLDSEVKAPRVDKPLRPRSLKAIGGVDLAARRKRIKNKLAKMRATRAKSRAKSRDQAR